MGMAELYEFASLSSDLLARKGGAKPAMRPALAVAEGELPMAGNELGWNDWGVNPQSGEVLENGRRQAAAPRPQVLQQIDDLAARLAPADNSPEAMAEPMAQVAPDITLPMQAELRAQEAKASASGRRAAFTLRLDAERHLQLKLASTMLGRSAQALMTQALDQFLSQRPAIRTLADCIRKPC